MNPALRPVTSDSRALPSSEDTLEAYLRRRGGAGGPIYGSLLLLLAATAGALPLIELPVSVRSRGVLRPADESHALFVAAAGEVLEVRGRPTGEVHAGDTLLVVARPGISAREGSLRARQRSLEEERSDLEELLSWAGGDDAAAPSGTRFGNERHALATEITALDQRERAARRELERASALMARGLIPAADAAMLEDRVKELRSEREILRSRAVSRWRGELAALNAEQESLAAEWALLEHDARQQVVVTPVSGVVEQMPGLAPGSLVSTGQQIATITPRSELIAELYLPPAAMGSVDIGSEVRLQLDAYRFTDWGTQTGQIFEVYRELVSVQGLVVGRVRVRLDDPTVRRPAGASELKGGASVSARIPVARRTLWALLREGRDRDGAGSAAPAIAATR